MDIMLGTKLHALWQRVQVKISTIVKNNETVQTSNNTALCNNSLGNNVGIFVGCNVGNMVGYFSGEALSVVRRKDRT